MSNSINQVNGRLHGWVQLILNQDRLTMVIQMKGRPSVDIMKHQKLTFATTYKKWNCHLPFSWPFGITRGKMRRNHKMKSVPSQWKQRETWQLFVPLSPFLSLFWPSSSSSSSSSSYFFFNSFSKFLIFVSFLLWRHLNRRHFNIFGANSFQVNPIEMKRNETA